MSKFKVIQGGLSVKVKCQACGKEVPSNDAYTNAFIWATLSEDKNIDTPQTGFRTASFNVCRVCAQKLIMRIQEYVREVIQ